MIHHTHNMMFDIFSTNLLVDFPLDAFKESKSGIYEASAPIPYQIKLITVVIKGIISKMFNDFQHVF